MDLVDHLDVNKITTTTTTTLIFGMSQSVKAVGSRLNSITNVGTHELHSTPPFCSTRNEHEYFLDSTRDIATSSRLKLAEGVWSAHQTPRQCFSLT